MKESIQLANGLEGVLFIPESGRSSAAVIILHERYGLVQHTLDLAQKLADDGYVAFAPNLFSRWDGDKAALTAGKARVIMPDPECTRVISQAIDLLRGDERTQSEKIFLMGVCQSGRYPIVVASQRNDIAGCVVFYGATQGRDWNANDLQPVSMPDMVAKLTVPSLFVFGEADHTISLDHVRRIRDALETHRKSYRMHVVRAAPHGFLNDTMPGRYRPCDTKVAWQMLLTFMEEVEANRWPAEEVRWEFESVSGADYDFSKNVRLE
ncbi:MAG: dienelactone hydrolase family protein [Herbaspirillum sp.]|nr:dienelactone hydrolase family protein [Herbaspirillum sp.]